MTDAIRNTPIEQHSPGGVTHRPSRSTYSVRPGDTMADIAANTGLSVEELHALNNHLIGQNGQPTPDMRLQI